MASVTDIDNFDLVVEPHEWTLEDREAIRQAVEELRKRETDARLTEHMRQWLARRHKAVNQTSQGGEG